MDPLSDVLSLLKPRSHVSAGFDAGGEWAVRFGEQRNQIKCYAVVSGAAWLSVEGVGEAVRLEAGDSFVLASGRPFRLASDLARPPIDADTIFPPAREGGVVSLGGGGDFFLVGSRFAVGGDRAGLLLAALPPVVHVERQTEPSTLRWLVERMMQELRDPQPGGLLVAQHLAHLMLVQALRLHLAEGPKGAVGWFSALADPRIGAAIAAMHAEPAHRWTVEALARRAGMSRSVFALRFRQTVGETPMDYLVRWRMLRAADRLESAREPISAIASSLGYESESAFSTAFKRVMGCPPRRYGRA